jgi:hypothetical protein
MKVMTAQCETCIYRKDSTPLVSTPSPLKAGPVGEAIASPTRVRWTVVALAAFVTGLTYVDRLNLGIVAKTFQEEFNFTAQSMGWILGAFSLGYAWFHLPGGWLADRFGGEVGSLESLPARLREADIVVSSTSSPHPIVEADDLAEVMRVRDGRPLVLIDIAVPRDIEHACGELEGVSVYDMDDLQAVVKRNLSVREAERSRADAVVEEEIQRFARWLAQLDVMPTIASLREHGAEIVDQVLAENAGRWETLSPRDLARVEAVARSVMQRLLHEPTIRLKESGHGRQQLLRELFERTAEMLETGTENADEAGAFGGIASPAGTNCCSCVFHLSS